MEIQTGNLIEKLIKIDYKREQEKIKTTMAKAVQQYESGMTGLINCANRMIIQDKEFTKKMNVIKICCFCNEYEGEMEEGFNPKTQKKIYAHPGCLKAERAKIV